MKHRRLAYHILFWLGIYLLWILLFRSYSVPITKTITVEFCYLIFITADYYAISKFTIPHFLHKRKYGLFVFATLLIIAFSAWLRAFIALQMNALVFHPKAKIDFGTLYLNSVLNISLWVLLVTIGKMLLDRIQTQQQLEMLEKERVKKELAFLKAQINPHAFFNSLNTIYGHIDKTNQVAREILLEFSELLRYQLYDCGEEKVILEKEVTYLTNYIDFQRLRKSENLVVRLEVGEIETGLTIAPLLLAVLAENAFKYVSNHANKENRIAVRIFTAGSTLHTCFFNTKEAQQPAAFPNSNGIGIVNLMRRLELLYPQKHKLATYVGNDSYETSLTIDLT